MGECSSTWVANDSPTTFFSMRGTRAFATVAHDPRSPAAGVINFAKGHPNPTHCLPHAIMARAMQASTGRLQNSASVRQVAGFPLSYGAAKGQPRLLSALSALITRRGGPQEVAARDDSLFITNGVSHGLDLVVQAFTLVTSSRTPANRHLMAVLLSTRRRDTRGGGHLLSRMRNI